MPELPEVETVRQHILPYARGTTIKDVEIIDPRNIKKIAPQKFRKLVKGKKIVSIDRRAKFLIFKLNDGAAFAVHLGMTGNLLFSPDKYTKVVFHLSAGKKIYFSDIRLFGKIYYYSKYPAFDDIGPEPFDKTLTSMGFYNILHKHKTKIKPLLLDQHFIAGLGNIYAIEALHAAYIHPERRADGISKQEAAKLLKAIRSILARAIKAGGSSISDFVHSSGQKGGFQRQHKVYGREGELCKKCSTAIKRIVLGQRGTYFCPKCQK